MFARPTGANLIVCRCERSGHELCLDFNRQLLMRAGMSPEDIEAMKADPSTALLEDREQIMLVFVAKALRAPKSVSQADVDSLRAEGWSDSDIFDALAHGANMLAGAAVFNALIQPTQRQEVFSESIGS